MLMKTINTTKIMHYSKFILVLVFCVQISIGSNNYTFRKHKVHNIVLYPDKHSWCTSTPIKQVVSDVDCNPVEIDNWVCLGACFSYSIPRTIPDNNVDEVNAYCDSCQPIKTLWIPVKLTCNDGSNHTKHVQLIKECRCSSCSRHWEIENPSFIDVDAAADEETPTQTSRYLELMKLENDENVEDEVESNTVTGVSDIEMQDTVNPATRLVYEKNIWIRGPHHSKVLLKTEMLKIQNITGNDDTQQYLEEDTDKNTF